MRIRLLDNSHYIQCPICKKYLEYYASDEDVEFSEGLSSCYLKTKKLVCDYCSYKVKFKDKQEFMLDDGYVLKKEK